LGPHRPVGRANRSVRRVLVIRSGLDQTAQRA
jgi:hypothetical protein